MNYLDELHHNLTSGKSYLTQQSSDCESDGQIIYDNIVDVAEILFGDEVTDQNYEYLVDEVSGGRLDAYSADLDTHAAAAALKAKWRS